MTGNIDKIDFGLEEIQKVENGKLFKVSIKVPDNLGFIDDVNLVIETTMSKENFPLKFISHNHEDGFVYFTSDIFLPTKALYHYYFTFTANKKMTYFKREGEVVDRDPFQGEKWKLAVNFEVPSWAKGKIMYHIFVDRFNRGSKEAPPVMPNRTIYASFNDEMIVGPNKDGIWNADFYGGDLLGIIEKLDYINSLGVSIIYLSPVVWSQSNHRYDAADYKKVDPYAGTNEDLKLLCEKAHEKGMKIVLDAVFNHTGNDSKYYNEFGTFDTLGAYQSKSSPYYKFYRTIDDGYYPRWSFAKKFPKLDEKNKKWNFYIYDAKGIIDLWYRFDKENKTERLEDYLAEEVKNWGLDFFNNRLNLDSNQIKYENNKFYYLYNGKYIPISNRMIYVLFSLKDGIDSLDKEELEVKDVINYVFLDSLLTFYKTSNGDKLSLVFDEFKSFYPAKTLEHIIEYINSNDITKVVTEMTKEKVNEDSNRSYNKYLNNPKDRFSYWWGMGNLPECNGYSKEWQQYIYGENGVIDKWFSLGIDGLRLDVADDLTDEFIEGIRSAVKRNKEDGFILGEVWKNPMYMKRGYLESGKGMDSVMNYSLVNALIKYYKYGNYEILRDKINELKYDYPDEVAFVLMNFTSTHDISRAINIFGTDEFINDDKHWAWDLKKENRDYEKRYEITKEQYQKGKDLLELYAFTLTFFPGILSIFYGDEVGLPGLGNIVNRKPFPKKKDEELLKFFRWIGNIRKNEHFLEEAGLEVVDLNDKIFIFERKKDNNKALIAVNRTSDSQKLLIPSEYERENVAYTLKKSLKKELTPYGGVVLKRKNM